MWLMGIGSSMADEAPIGMVIAACEEMFFHCKFTVDKR